jgi:hypothetical protein
MCLKPRAVWGPNQEAYSMTDSRLIPVTEWPKFHTWPPVGGLRHIIFNADSNGFAPCIKRVGRRVLIDEARFFEIVETQNQKVA